MICLTVDNLGGIAEGEPLDPGHPALAIGLARMLALFAETGVRATFFAEGYAAVVFPAALARIRDAGHELALHAWKHERWGELAPEREAELLALGVDAFEKTLGERPRGFRPPGGKLTDASPRLLARHGLRYVSAARGHERGLPGVSFDWARVDAFSVYPRFGGRREPDEYFESWRRDALAHEAAVPREPWLAVAHPFCAGMDPYFEAFARCVRRLAADAGPSAFRTLESLLPPSC